MSKDELPTVSIKGNEYVMVKDRIRYFNETYPTGMIHTDLVRYEAGQVIFLAKVFPEAKDLTRFFTGFSQARETQGMINKMAALENAETSAVGRALAMMGIGVIDSVASADELAKANVVTNDDPDFGTPKQAALPVNEETEDIVREPVPDDSDPSFCQMHQVKMFRKEGKYGVFYSHGEKQEDGSYRNCNGKGWK